MRVAFAASDETIRLITAEGFQVLRDGGPDHTVVLTEVDPRMPRALEGSAAVLLEVPERPLAQFRRSEADEIDAQTFDVPVSFVERFPILATRAGTPAAADVRETEGALKRPRPLPRGLLMALLVLVIGAVWRRRTSPQRRRLREHSPARAGVTG